jgi:transposase
VARQTACDEGDLGFADFFHEHRDGVFPAVWLVCRDRHEADETRRTQPTTDAPHVVWLVEMAGVTNSVEDLPTEVSIPNEAEV